MNYKYQNGIMTKESDNNQKPNRLNTYDISHLRDKFLEVMPGKNVLDFAEWYYQTKYGKTSKSNMYIQMAAIRESLEDLKSVSWNIKKLKESLI